MPHLKIQPSSLPWRACKAPPPRGPWVPVVAASTLAASAIVTVPQRCYLYRAQPFTLLEDARPDHPAGHTGPRNKGVAARAALPVPTRSVGGREFGPKLHEGDRQAPEGSIQLRPS